MTIRAAYDRPTSLDLVASAAAALLPKALSPAIDRVRLDARAVVAGLSGRPPRPFHGAGVSRLVPPPLDAIDPLGALLPGSLGQAYETAKRDVRTILDGFAGRRPPAFTTRSAGRRHALASLASPSPAPVALVPRPLRVARVVRETADAVSLVLVDPEGPIDFVPGQFFTLLVDVGGEILRRAYSASCAPGELADGAVRVTIKRVGGGRASNHLVEHAREGETVQVFGPSGAFVATPSADAARHLVLVAGGSGVTPMMAIARAILAGEPRSRVSLAYGNRALEDVIFRDELAALEAAHDGRFAVRHVLQEPPKKWKGARGLLAGEVLAGALDAIEAAAPELAREYFVCGPEGMMSAARALIAARGVPEERIREERFSSPQLRPTTASVAAGPQPITLRTKGGERVVTTAPAQTLLEAGLAAGVAMPFSCTLGGCGACKVKLLEGEVEMEEPNCLARAERDHGHVLACVSRAKTPCTIEVPG